MAGWDRSADIRIEEGSGAVDRAVAEAGVEPGFDLHALQVGLGFTSISGVLPELPRLTPDQLYTALPPIAAIPPTRFNGKPKLLAIVDDRTLATAYGVLHFTPKLQNVSLWGTGVLLVTRDRGPIAATEAVRTYTHWDNVDSRPVAALRNRVDGMFERLAERMARVGIGVLFESGLGVVLEPGIAVADCRRQQ